MRIVIISDTHNQHDALSLPEGDLLIHCGDMTGRGSLSEINEVAQWFSKQDFKYKCVIAGNHDWAYQNDNKEAATNLLQDAGCTYLQDSYIEIEGLLIYGSPWTPFFHNWAFNLHRGAAIAEKWELIPEATNILITHGPPYGILDLVETYNRDPHQGCKDLLNKVKQLKNLKLHCAGHLHLNGGQTKTEEAVIFANAAICTEQYEPTNPPIVIDL